MDTTRFKEFMDLMEEVYDLKDEAKDVASAFSKRIKDAQATLDDWAKKNQMELSTIKSILGLYIAFKAGKLKWTDGEDDNFMTLLNALIDQVQPKEKK